ncbi:MAG: NADH-quinone oxidoreductase subunit NuoK [Chloroflexota bacterium]
MTTIPLHWWLLVATGLFCLGMYAVLVRKSTIAILMGLELMLNAVNINLVAFQRYVAPQSIDGQAFAIFVIVIAAAEAAVALAIIIAAYRQRQTIEVESFDSMQF